MIVSTINVNGIRAAVKERSAENLGLLPWLAPTRADVVCLQETRADDEQLAAALAPALATGWHLAAAEPHLKGRNGVAILSQHPFAAVRVGSGSEEFRSHGRYLEVDATAQVADRGQPLYPDGRGRHAASVGEGTVHGRRSRCGWRSWSPPAATP